MTLYRLIDRLRHSLQRKRLTPRLALAMEGEDAAMRYLQRRGVIVIAKNYRTRARTGEIDLIGWDGETLVFFEVKTRSDDAAGTPDRAVTPVKRRKIERAAREYAYRAGVDIDAARFDVVAVLEGRVEHFQDAFRPWRLEREMQG